MLAVSCCSTCTSPPLPLQIKLGERDEIGKRAAAMAQKVGFVMHIFVMLPYDWRSACAGLCAHKEQSAGIPCNGGPCRPSVPVM